MKKVFLSIVTIILMMLQGCNSPQSLSIEYGDSFIPMDTANKMLNSYINSIDSSKVGTQLYSMILDADGLRSYLDDTSITMVKVMFAHSLEYINSGNQNQDAGMGKGLTIILGGVNKSGNYVFAPDNKVLNKARLCPPMCITTGTAAQNVFE